MKKQIWIPIIVLFVILGLSMALIRQRSTVSTGSPLDSTGGTTQSANLQVGNVSAVGQGQGNPITTELQQGQVENIVPILIRDPNRESIVNYNFTCVKGRTLEAQITSGGKNPNAHVTVFDSSRSTDGQIESREFKLIGTASPVATEQRFVSADGSIVLVFNGVKANISEYGKTTLYKDCPMTASEIIK